MHCDLPGSSNDASGADRSSVILIQEDHARAMGLVSHLIGEDDLPIMLMFTGTTCRELQQCEGNGKRADDASRLSLHAYSFGLARERWLEGRVSLSSEVWKSECIEGKE